ncbi:uncharacterized protein CLUP02_08929 [Colletotrichum lupini]|uniref:Uncharacterized protein n=1 Tax=Colletotrichum lupini TaxID=145971 RepID=A0A9Q8STT3_9PEZI|nr:uncharacterized protein CLUP02_08929 [Colletotrichum lupini]UQC83434.1 hypothetical protein CLUP02_08929 [Colletotrichum lupini]
MSLVISRSRHSAMPSRPGGGRLIVVKSCSMVATTTGQSKQISDQQMGMRICRQQHVEELHGEECQFSETVSAQTWKLERALLCLNRLFACVIKFPFVNKVIPWGIGYMERKQDEEASMTASKERSGKKTSMISVNEYVRMTFLDVKIRPPVSHHFQMPFEAIAI